MAETETINVPVAAEAVHITTEDGQKKGEEEHESAEAPAQPNPNIHAYDSVREDVQENGADTSKGPAEFTNGQKNGQKRRNRRKARGGKHHRKNWKPYSKLSWEERQKVDEKETIRATRRRDDLFKSGLPMAPYNTTQFIMNDQDQPSPNLPDPDLHVSHRERHSRDDASGSYESSDGDFYDSPSDEDAFLEKEFSEAYESFHAERLHQLTKEELVKEYIELENKNESLEKELKDVRTGSRSSSDRDLRLPSEESLNVTQVSNMEEEMKELKAANAKLGRENEFLKAVAGKMTAVQDVQHKDV